VASGAIDGDGYVSAAMGEVGLASGKRAVALLWKVAFAAYDVEAEVKGGRGLKVVASGVGAVRLAGLYFLHGSPLLEGDEKVINHKLAEAVKLGAEGLSVSWEGLRLTKSRVAADLIMLKQNGKTLLMIRITAEVDGVTREYTITYGRYGYDNKTRGFAYASAKAPGGREVDAERLAAVIKALTGKEPRIRRRSDGKIEVVCYEEHLEGFMRYREFAEAIAGWLEETSR
jgi:hypothetical protein